MRLANLRNFKFSDLNFYHYFFTAYIGLHVTFSLLLGNITALAVDEEVYRDMFGRLYSPGTNFSDVGFQMAWKPWLQVIYFPAKILTFLGFTDLYAIRFLSIGCSTLATYLIIKIARDNNRDDRIFRLGLLSISFIPTVFLWSSIGLRESFLYLSISFILFTLTRIRIEPKWYWYLLLAIAFLSLSQTKSYIFVIMMIALIISVVIDVIQNRRTRISHTVLLILAILPLLINPPLAKAVKEGGQTQIVISVSEVPTKNTETGTETGTESGEPSEVIVASRGMTVHVLVKQLQSNSNSLISKIAQDLGITAKLEANSKNSVVVQGSTVDQTNRLQLSSSPAKFTTPSLFLKSIARFLFIPLIFVDNGSLFLNIQSIETPVWIFMYLIFFFALYKLVRGRRKIDFAISTAVIFVSEFVILSALTEVNVGTALRHRSLLLIPILVIWAGREKESASF